MHIFHPVGTSRNRRAVVAFRDFIFFPVRMFQPGVDNNGLTIDTDMASKNIFNTVKPCKNLEF